ncbi:MAG: hypothetical protein HYS13_00310 [Planctomycetia bacterium]|nr:hypothetical protein [Planctomycetia bacterium]
MKAVFCLLAVCAMAFLAPSAMAQQRPSVDDILKALDAADQPGKLWSEDVRRQLHSTGNSTGKSETVRLGTVVEQEGATLEGCDECLECEDCCWWGGEAFFAVDGWKSRIDDDRGNNFGVRGGLNLAAPLTCDGWNGQLGASYGGYDFHGRDNGESSSVEDQVFITGGVFRNADPCGCNWYDAFNAGVVYDQMFTDNSGDPSVSLTVGQVRFYVGYLWDDCNEVGVWGATDTDWDILDIDDNNPTNVRRTRSLQQISAFWRHQWCYGADTMAYVGVAEDPGEVVFGFRGSVPLNDCLAMTAGFHYILPSTSGGDFPVSSWTEEYWNVYAGFTYYLGAGRPCSLAGSGCSPLLPVADNGTFALETGPGNF